MATPILLLNCGSSSVKYQVIDADDEAVLATGLVQKIGLDEGTVDYREAMAQPDAHDLSPLGESTMWAGEPAPDTTPRDSRVLLLDPPAGWSTVAGSLVAPVLGSGSTVVAVGVTADRAAEIAAAERALLA